MEHEDKKRARVIAYLGKGGAGKTAMSCLTAHLLLGRPEARILLIDADPAMGMVFALGKQGVRTVGDVRAGLLDQVRRSGRDADKHELSMTVDYLMLEALEESGGYCLLAMGRTDGPGCYCPVNSLLRDSIEDLARSFDLIVIDAEAGIEQVSRQVVRRVDHPVIVTDRSMRGAATAEAIRDALERVGSRPPTGVVINRLDSPDPSLAQRLEGAGLPVLGAVPPDAELARFDREGRSLLELPDHTPALTALKEILSNAGICFPRK